LVAHDGSRERAVRAEVVENSKKYEVNGKRVSVADGILGKVPVVVFTPDNLGLVKDAASARRRELDAVGRQLSKNYVRLGREYEKALKGRNRLLADGYASDPAFEAWTEQVVVIGAALFEHRVKLMERLAPLIVEHFSAIDATSELGVSYENNWGARKTDDRGAIEMKLAEALEASGVDERARRITLVGPHRDDIVFTLDGHEARLFGSQGQQRTIALAWKLAEVSLIKEVLGVSALLLLDDVMSELDGARRAALMERVGTSAQTVVTTTNIAYFEPALLDRATVIEIG
jgi:DNA replication and repair protein RecF